MIGIDTNILLRVLLDDDGRQSPAARSLLSSEIDSGRRVFISVVTLVETIWTLARRKGDGRVPRTEIANTIARLLASPDLVVEKQEQVNAALKSYRTGAADFSDYLIAELGSAAGAVTTYTFDRAASTAPGFTLLSA